MLPPPYPAGNAVDGEGNAAVTALAPSPARDGVPKSLSSFTDPRVYRSLPEACVAMLPHLSKEATAANALDTMLCTIPARARGRQLCRRALRDV